MSNQDLSGPNTDDNTKAEERYILCPLQSISLSLIFESTPLPAFLNSSR